MRIEEYLKKGLGCGQNKFFVIGFNKTAGTTIANLCMKNLLEARHQPNWGFSEGLGKNNRGNFWNKFKCFSDGGDREDFKLLSKNYPDSLFILNCRPIKDWLFSRFKHGVFEQIKDRKNNTPPPRDSTIYRLGENGTRKFTNYSLYPCTAKKLEAWITRYQEHHLEVINHFSQCPEKLIIIDISQPNWITFLSKHSGLEPYQLHSNARSKDILTEEDIGEFNSLLEKACGSLGICINDINSTLLLPQALTQEVKDSFKFIKNNLKIITKKE